MSHPTPSAVSRFISAPDGLKLHVRDHGPLFGEALPVVCLPGLSRTADDFEALAFALAQGAAGKPRRVLCPDYRGRGLSDWDPDWKNYDAKVESADILAILDASGVEKAVLVGTSRGGINTMAIAAMRPAVLAGAVLNDIGPVLEAKGLARIRSYIGKLPPPASWADAAGLLKHISDTHFTSLSDADWDRFARLTFKEDNGRLVGKYDPALMKTLAGLDLEAPLPTLWPQFEGLGHVPALVLRGGNSDLLSQATAEEMTRRHPDSPCSSSKVRATRRCCSTMPRSRGSPNLSRRPRRCRARRWRRTRCDNANHPN